MELIETDDELNSQIIETVIRDDNGGVFERWSNGWHEVGYSEPQTPSLPASVLFEPRGEL